MSPFKFGMRAKVRDSVTKVVFVIIGRMEYTSYNSYYLQPVEPSYQSGGLLDPVWLDEDRLEDVPADVEAPPVEG
jgi:hypothetical protein